MKNERTNEQKKEKKDSMKKLAGIQLSMICKKRTQVDFARASRFHNTETDQ
jgi:hypothetical protein